VGGFEAPVFEPFDRHSGHAQGSAWVPGVDVCRPVQHPPGQRQLPRGGRGFGRRRDPVLKYLLGIPGLRAPLRDLCHRDAEKREQVTADQARLAGIFGGAAAGERERLPQRLHGIFCLDRRFHSLGSLALFGVRLAV